MKPLSFGKLIKRTMGAAMRRFHIYALASLVTFLPVFVITFLMIWLSISMVGSGAEGEEWQWITNAICINAGGSLLLMVISLFFSVQFSTGLVVASVKWDEEGENVTMRSALKLAAARYGGMTRTLWSIMLCSLGLGVIAIPLAFLMIIPVVGAIAIFAFSIVVQLIYMFSLCAAAADGRKGFGAIRFGASVMFRGGLWKSLLQTTAFMVVFGIVISGTGLLSLSGAFSSDFAWQASHTWLVYCVVLWVSVSVLMPFMSVFSYYLYVNARIRSAIKAKQMIAELQSGAHPSWEAYKIDEAQERYTMLLEDCPTFDDDGR